MIFSTKKREETHSVRPGSSLLKWPEKTKKYINHARYILKLSLQANLVRHDVKAKVYTSFSLAFNILGTGLIIQYCLRHNNFASYGLTSALLLYYFKFITNTIKQPYQKKE